MSSIKTYKEGHFSQINLSDGNKILISRGTEDTRVFQAGFLGIPKRKVHIFSDLYISYLIRGIGITSDTVEYLANELVKADTLAGAKAKCLQLEADMAEKNGYKFDVSSDPPMD